MKITWEKFYKTTYFIVKTMGLITTCLITILFLMLIFGCLYLGKKEEKEKFYEKPSIIAGYKSGTFFDVHLLLYPDSTYYYSNSDKEPNGIWIHLADTIILKQRDTVQSILVNKKPIVTNNPRYNWLHNMEFIENNPPKIVKFPKHD